MSDHKIRDTRATRASFAIGALFVLTGTFAPSSALVDSLGPSPMDIREALLLGASLFRYGLVMFGLFIMMLARSSIWNMEIPVARSRPSSVTNYHLLVMAGILLGAVVLRIYALDSGLWLDEILTYVKYARKPFGEIISTFDSQNQHPLYSLLARASFLTFGESAWALRLPAVIFGTASIWALYLLGCQVSSVREALLSSTLLALSYHHIWFSQNARGYTGLLFWTLFSSWLLLRGLEEGRRRIWLLYGTTAALGVYTHLTMLFVILGHFIIYLGELYRRRKETWQNKWVGLFLGFCVAGFLTFQLHALVLPQLLSGTLGEKSTVAAWKHPLWTLIEFAKGMQVGFAGGVAGVLAFLIFGAGVLSYRRTNPVVLQLLIIPAVMGAAMVLGVGHHLWPRFVFFTIGFGALITIRGGMALGEGLTRLVRVRQPLVIGTTVCALLTMASALSIPFVYAPKQDYGGALAFVESNRRPEDAIVTVGLAKFPYKTFYKVDWQDVENLQMLNRIRSQVKRTWVVYTIEPHLQAVYPEIMESIRREFRTVRKFHGTLRGGTVFVCRSDASPSHLQQGDIKL